MATEWYADRKVLVTGGCGFIGSNLARRLADAGAKVTVVDSMQEGCGGNRRNLEGSGTPIRVIEAHISRIGTFAHELRETAVIFNLAGEISHSRSMSDPERDLQLNAVEQLRFLLECRRQWQGIRIVYAGTRQVYGRPCYLPVDEEHPIRPVDFNGIHKYAATQYHLMMADCGDLDAIVLRLSNVYGPRMALDQPQQGFLGVYLNSTLEGRPLLVYGEGEQLRDPVHVDDVVDAFLLAGSRDAVQSQTYNIGGPEALSLNEIAGHFSRCGGNGFSRRPFPAGLKQIDIGSYHSDITLAREELGWEPQIQIESGIESTVAWYRARQQGSLALFGTNPVPLEHPDFARY